MNEVLYLFDEGFDGSRRYEIDPADEGLSIKATSEADVVVVLHRDTGTYTVVKSGLVR